MSLDRPPALDHESPANVFYLVPSMHESGREGCAALCAVDRPDRMNFLSVLTRGTPDDRLEEWRTHVDDRLPARASFVVLGDEMRSASAAATAANVPEGTEINVQTIPDPGNLTRIGIATSSVLMEWADDDRPTVLCFRSMTTLLQYASTEKVYRFFHELTGHVRAVDGIGHYHLDPTAHEEREVNTLKTLFDSVVEVGDDGWKVWRR